MRRRRRCGCGLRWGKAGLGVLWWLVCLRRAGRVVCGGLGSDLDLGLGLDRDWAAVEASHMVVFVLAEVLDSVVEIDGEGFAGGVVDEESKEVVASRMVGYIVGAVVVACC